MTLSGTTVRIPPRRRPWDDGDATALIGELVTYRGVEHTVTWAQLTTTGTMELTLSERTPCPKVGHHRKRFHPIKGCLDCAEAKA